jgi:hypothetical protein
VVPKVKAADVPPALVTSSSLTLFRGMEKYGGDERSTSRRWAVRICCAVGSLAWTVWDDALEKEGEVGSGEMEDTECRCELEITDNR